MSLFPDEDVLTKEIETWCGFIDKLPSDEDKAVLTKLLKDCYKYSVAINSRYSELCPIGRDTILVTSNTAFNRIPVISKSYC
jgi:hypothetical protein